MSTSDSKQLVQNPDSLSDTIDGEVVLMSPVTDSYCTLNETGAAIWDLLKKPITMKRLVECLANDFGIENDKIERQVFLFVNRLSEEGLILEVK